MVLLNSYKDKYFWIFYLIKENGYYGTDNYDIYAFTDDKNISKRFKATRNMKIFFVKKIKLDRQGMNDLIRHHMVSELKMYEGIFIGNDYKIQSFELPLTLREKETCDSLSSLYANEYVYRYAWNDASVFKDKYYDALKTLFYVHLHRYLYIDDSEWEEVGEKLLPNNFNILMSQFGPMFIEYESDGD